MADEITRALDRIVAGEVAAAVESSTLDFKTQGRSIGDTLEDLADAVACFANGGGGSVIVGVADKVGGAEAFVGHSLDVDATKHRLFELTDPPLLADVRAVHHAAGSVLVITVPRGATVHRVKRKMPAERVGTSCETMSTQRVAAVIAERSGDDWSAHDSGVPIAQVDELAIASARVRLERSEDTRRRTRARLSTPDLLRALGVVTSEGVLTNAGALLFSGISQFPTVLAYVYRRTPAGGLAVNEQLGGPMLPALERAFELVEARIESTSVNLGQGQQVQVGDLPVAAVREAIVNAVMHRDYRRSDRVTIEHSPTRMRVTSPGGFISGVTVHNVLTTSSRTRNQQLASAIRELGFAETAGTGVDRMFAEMARIGHEPPLFEADPDLVRVTLAGGAPNATLTRFVATLPPSEADDADTMLTLLTLLSRRLVDAELMSHRLQKPNLDEAEAVLVRLASDPVRLIEPTRETARSAHPRYRLREEPVAALGATVKYYRRTPDQLDRKVIAMVAETGTINSKMVQLMLDLDVRAASRQLRQLVERGILARTSKATRGVGVTYGPGAKFPRSSRRRSESRTQGSAQQDELELD